MRTLYLECKMGAAGDMLTAALFELLTDDRKSDFLKRINNAGIPGVSVAGEKITKQGVRGTHMRVLINGQKETAHNHNHECNHEHKHEHNHNHNHGHEHGHDHSHNDYASIEHLIGHLSVSESVKENAAAVYKVIAEAESIVHGVPVNQIHFHEVGTMDAVADIVGVCMLMEELSPDMVSASPVNTGSGHVHCAHGILPVPAPATVHILRGIPVYSDESGELCTPTGAALLKHFVREFREIPIMTVTGIGYGMGSKDFKKLNCVRAYIGDSESKGSGEDTVSELACNLDDMTPESVAFASQLLISEGALDVTVTPTVMKKGRSGVILCCLCKNDLRDKMISLIFKHTTTLGVREYLVNRYTLQRTESEISTKFGTVRIKTSFGYGAEKKKAEYDDIEKIATQKSVTLDDVLRETGL